jgi:uncharacterized protein
VVRSIRTLLAALLLLAAAGPIAAPLGAVTATAALAQEDRLAVAAAFARDLSRLEADRDWSALAALMHPDSRAVVPAAVVVGWYDAAFAGKTTSELTVTGAEPVQWTWPVSGAVYDAVRVSFVQPYWVDGERSDEPGVVHLAETPDGGWGWFFGGSRAFVDQQLARYVGAAQDAAPAVGGLQDAVIDPAAVRQAERAARFPDPLHAHVDAFWADRFAQVGLPYQPPGGVVAFDAPIPTGCGVADPATETAFYCVLDGTIYYAAEFRRIIEQNIGDFGWVVVVAHEWGHHVQLLLGYDAGVLSWAVGRTPSVAMEQQADCLAGAYADSAEFSGWLDPGDIDEALLITGLSGDPVGTAPGDPEAHGSGPERVAAFSAGYAQGLAACGLGGPFAGG